MTRPVVPPFPLVDRPVNTSMLNAVYNDLLNLINNLPPPPPSTGIPGWYNLVDYGAVPDYRNGRIGTITGGTNSLVVSSAVGLRVGNYLVIEGVVGSYLIDHISGTTVTLHVDIPAGPGATDSPVYTDNYLNILACLAAAKRDENLPHLNKLSKVLFDGRFFSGYSIDVEQTVCLQGVATTSPSIGVPLRSDVGSLLVFPANTTGLRFHGTQSSDVAGLTAFLSKSGSTITLTGGDDFTPLSVGKTITITNSSTPGNDGAFLITTYHSPTSVSWENASGANDFGVVAGAAASLHATTYTSEGISYTLVTLTGGSGFTPDLPMGSPIPVGSKIRITGSATPGNNGVFTITRYNSSTSVSWINNSAATDLSGAVSWSVGEVTFGVGGYASAENSSVIDLTLSCRDAPDLVTNNYGHGISTTVKVFLSNLDIESFANHGVLITGNFFNDNNGLPDYSALYNVLCGNNGADGFHLRGADAAACTLTMCVAEGNGRFGVCDQTKQNTYSGFGSEYNSAPGITTPMILTTAEFGYDGYGSNYHTEGSIRSTVGYNTSTFLGCECEGQEPGRENRFYGSTSIIGGTLGFDEIYYQAAFGGTGLITAWSITSDVVTFTYSLPNAGGLKYFAGQVVSISGFAGSGTIFNGSVLTVLPTGLSPTTFEAAFAHVDASGVDTGTATLLGPTGGNILQPDSTVFLLDHGVASFAPLEYSTNRFITPYKVQLGADSGSASIDALLWQLLDSPYTDFSRLSYDVATGWWTLYNNSVYRRPISFPSVNNNMRRAAPWFLHGIFLGDDAGGVQQSIISANGAIPSTVYSGSPSSFLVGDLVVEANVSPGARLGWRCITPGVFGTATFEELFDPNGPTPVAMVADDVDWAASKTHTKTLAPGANTFTFSNVRDGMSVSVAVIGSASTLTWPVVEWVGSVAPTQTASGKDLYSFLAVGGSIIGSVLQNVGAP